MTSTLKSLDLMSLIRNTFLGAVKNSYLAHNTEPIFI
jgi:hypothetical protein